MAIILFIIADLIKQVYGGVGLYLKSEFEYKIRVELTFDDMVCVESVFVEISRPKGKIIIVGVIYDLRIKALMNY